jgi:hypothetical protein
VSELESLQHLVIDAVRRPSSGLEGEDLQRADAHIRPSVRGMRPAERLEVYREQYWLRHVANLAEDFPTLAWVLGDDAFGKLVLEYLVAFPPRTWNLQCLGADMPAFVEHRVTGERSRLACDAARLDWAFMEAFDAPDAAPFDPGALASTPEDAWPAALVAFHPSLRTLDLHHAAHDLRDAIARGEAPQAPAPAATPLVVWRDPACYLHAVTIDPLAFALLRELREGAALGPAGASIAAASGADDPSELGPRVAEWFRQWTGRAWVCAVSFPL